MRAMILAAGRGERMRPLTDRMPKPLLEAGGKPLIVWHIERLVRSGFTELVINHAHLGAMIEEALGDGSRFAARIRYSPEAEALETAGGIAQALPLLGNAPFLVINGDIWCDCDLHAARDHGAALAASGRLAHIVLVPNPAHHASGDFCLRNADVISEGEPRFTFSGIGVYLPGLFGAIAPGAKAKLAPLLRAAIAERKVSGELHCGRWFDVGTPQRLAELDSELRNARVP